MAKSFIRMILIEKMNSWKLSRLRRIKLLEYVTGFHMVKSQELHQVIRL